MENYKELKEELNNCQLRIEDTERKLFVITDGALRDSLLEQLSTLYDKRSFLKSQITPVK